MSVPFQHDVLRRMESLLSHVISELLQVESEFKQIQSEPTPTPPHSSSRCKKEVKTESSKLKREPAVKVEGVKTESIKSESSASEESAVAAAAAEAASSSSAKPVSRSRRSALSRCKDTIIIQYAPPDLNCSRDEQGVLHCHLPAADQVAAAAAASAPAEGRDSLQVQVQPPSRWAATPVANNRSKKRKKRSSQRDESESSSQRGESDSESAESAAAAAAGADGSDPDLSVNDVPNDSNGGSVENRVVSGSIVRTRQLVVPGRGLSGHRHLAALFRHMSTCYVKMTGNSRAALRELWYDDKALFKSKAYSDGALRLLGAVLGVERAELNVVADAKGFIMGEIQFELEDFSDAQAEAQSDAHSSAARSIPAVTLVNCTTPQLITPFVKQIRGMQCSATWLLLVEKYTVFRRFVESAFPLTHNCIVITDKGMPSIATRQFLCLIHRHFPFIPMYTLVDADPDGIGIHAEYKYCSKRSAALAERLQLPQLQFLGLSLSDVEALGILPRVKLALSQRDRSRIRNLLGSEVGQSDVVISRELESMQRLNCKAEIEALSVLGNDFLAEFTLRKRRHLMDEAERYAAEHARETAAAAAAMPEEQSQPVQLQQQQQQQSSHSLINRRESVELDSHNHRDSHTDARHDEEAAADAGLQSDEHFMFHTSDTYTDDGNEWFA